MKKLLFIITVLNVYFVNSQAFTGSGDSKFQIGLNLQDNATGINASYDFGVGENMSLGFSSSYALGVNDFIDADFSDRADIKARFNANLGNVINLDEKFDIYPGLNFSLKSFGTHLGMRYFFTSGFGVYTEFNLPLAKYDTGALTHAEKLHNQFTANIGASFNL